ncbi:MAG: DUF4856 domain-containing protein [Bacteroidota bacterium]|nr:DUF4856 domain-containing protein [Bacteroidota bacterium]
MKNLNYLSTLTLAGLLAFSSCKKDTKEPEPTPEPAPVPTTPTYTIPTSYNFTNSSATITSTQRIAMLGELTTYIRSTHTMTTATQPTISAQQLKDMYANVNNFFTGAGLNASGIQLKDKTGNTFSFQTLLEANFDDAQLASIAAAANPTTTTASSGVKGKLVSPARAILVNGNGFEYKEYAEKGLMGAVFYHQATTILSTIGALDNTTLTLVNGATAQERAWDEAFGYFGVPVDFPTNLTGLKNWGSYCNSVNVAIGSNALIMNAFLKGRAAIVNKDTVGRNAARTAVINNWEKVAAAKCISYLKGAKNNLSDPATLHHNLSEGWGFVAAFQYNPNKTISNADITTLLGYFGTNLYNMPTANLDLAIAKLETVFGLNASLIP